MTDLSNKPILTCQQVSKSVLLQSQALTILEDINFSVSSGESLAIVGQSGSGKTSLLSLLAGLDLPSSGTIELFEQTLSSMDEDQRAALRNQKIGFVFQSFHLLPGFTALENVMAPLEINNDKNAAALAKQFLERVEMGHRLDHFPSTLSGGEQQRVAIARAFATNPPLLLADEPTGNLDTQTGEHIIELLFELNQEQGTTLILVTHDKKLAARCQRCLSLNAGRLEEIDPESLLA